MLASAGPVLHSTISSHQSRFKNTWGCVLVNLAEDLVFGITMAYSDGKEFMVPILYKDVLKICAICKYRGHLPVLCPQKTARSLPNTQAPSPPPTAPAVTG